VIVSERQNEQLFSYDMARTGCISTRRQWSLLCTRQTHL